MTDIHDRWKTATPADKEHIEECECDACHESHIEERIFAPECARCQEEKCETCAGVGYTKDGNAPCAECASAGRHF